MEKIMKNFNKVRLKKDSIGRLSDVGAYGYWYPSFEHKTKLLNDCDAEHLPLWRNQDPYYAFKIKAANLDLSIKIDEDKDVCVWFTEDEIVTNLLGKRNKSK